MYELVVVIQFLARKVVRNDEEETTWWTWWREYKISHTS